LALLELLVAELLDEGGEALAVVVGEGPLAEELQQRRRLGAEAHALDDLLVLGRRVRVVGAGRRENEAREQNERHRQQATETLHREPSTLHLPPSANARPPRLRVDLRLPDDLALA